MPPRPSKVRSRRLRRRWKRWARIAGIVFAAGLGVGIIGLVAAFAIVSRDLPNPNRIIDRAIAQSTRIYDRTGQTLLYEIHGDKKRTVINFHEIPTAVKEATIAAEDRDFYHHKGFDLRGILRALLRNAIHLDLHGEGGSTITQQFIKNSILTKEKSYIRKFKELILAYQLERKFTKDQILGLYLNEIPYGTNAYGIEAAAQTYLGKPAKELTLAESALLAGLPRAPSYYSPYGNHTDEMFARQQYVLTAMADLGYVTNEQADAAKQEKVKVRARRESITAPHFVFYVREQLSQRYGENTVEQGGLKVITTLDMKNQKAAEDAIMEFGQRNQDRYNASNAALVSLDTKTGQVLAMVGSRDYFDTEHDGNVNVALRPRQPGSSLKPFVYATAFERGYTPETMVFDLVTNFAPGSPKPYTPHDYDNKTRGPISLRRALAGSLNIPAVKVLYLAGVNNVLDTLDRFGYTTLKDRSRYGLSLVLGGGEVKLLEHTSAYATLAREGMRHPVSSILKVENKNGKTLEQFTNHESRVMDAEVVRKLNAILTDNDARSYIFGSHSPLILPDRPVAAKTGTTNDFRDGWTMGFTPSIATGVWVGNNDNAALKRGSDGVVVAAPIWNSYMKRVLMGTPVETFKPPAPDKVDKPILRGQIDTVRSFSVDKITGKVIPESCRDTYPPEFIENRDFKETHTILYWVNKSDPRGPSPARPQDDPQFASWEGAVHGWAASNGYRDIKKLPQENCGLRAPGTGPSVAITSPSSDAVLTAATNTFSATTSGGGSDVSVSYTIDSVPVGTAAASPYDIVYANTQFENGPHTFVATATDVVGNKGASSVRFTYAMGDEARTLAFLSPQANAVFQASDFPIEVRVSIFEPAGIRSVQLLNNGTVLATSQKTTSGTFTFIVNHLDPGSQTLLLRAESATGAVTNSPLPLTIR